MNEDYPDVFWIEDSGISPTCHINGKGLSFDASLIGRLVERADGWHAFLKDKTSIGSDVSLFRARKLVEDYYSKNGKVMGRPAPRL